MSNTLAVTGLSNYNVNLTPEAREKRQELLESAALIITITSPEDQVEAVEAAAALKQWTKDLDTARVAIKRPILDAGNIVEALAKEAAAPAIKEAKRIEGLLVDFHQQQEAARRKALAEQERIEREAREKREATERAEKARLDEIERQRLAAERQAIEARSKKAREAAAAEAKRLTELQESEELASEFKTEEPIPDFVAPPEVVKPTGGTVKAVIKFEVTDIKKLYAAHPELVELVAKTQAINYFLSTPGRDLSNIPGLKAWEETKVVVRSTAAKPERLTY